MGTAYPVALALLLPAIALGGHTWPPGAKPSCSGCALDGGVQKDTDRAAVSLLAGFPPQLMLLEPRHSGDLSHSLLGGASCWCGDRR